MDPVSKGQRYHSSHPVYYIHVRLPWCYSLQRGEIPTRKKACPGSNKMSMIYVTLKNNFGHIVSTYDVDHRLPYARVLENMSVSYIDTQV